MEWLYYLLEANLYLLLFYAFYRFALQHQTFYSSNRFYLLASSITAFLIPLTQLGLLKPAPIVYQMDVIQDLPVEQTIDYKVIIYSIYVLIALVFAFKLATNLFKIIRIWLKAKKTNKGTITFIELDEQSTAFSFFNLLFIHPSLASKPTVLKHEMVHIKQKHSFDILFFEILQIICWFNPMIYFIKKDIKLLHEYIADDESTDVETDKHAYAMFLIENSFGTPTTPLANQFFNQSILKRRINMLNKKKSGSWSQLRIAMAVPLTGIMLCASTLAFSKDYGYFDLLPEKSNVIASLQQDVKPVKKAKTEKDQVKFPPPIVKPDGKNLKTPPPVEPPPPSYRTKKDQVKFPPPVVKPDGKNLKTPPPVEPPPPSYRTKKDQVKFPPPIVKPDGKILKTSPTVVPPPVPQKEDQVKFPPPIVKPDKKNINDRAEDVTKTRTLREIQKNQEAMNAGNKRIEKSLQQQITRDQVKVNQEKVKAEIKKEREKSNAEKLTKLYNASKFQTMFYPTKEKKEEVGC